jgi:Putative transposase
MTLPVDEFLRRFLLHLLPRGFMRIRNFGFLANRRRAELLSLCFRLLRADSAPTLSASFIRSLGTLPLELSYLWRSHAGYGNASPQPHFFSDLHLPQAGAQHELTSSSRNLARATARMPVVCLVRIKERFIYNPGPPKHLSAAILWAIAHYICATQTAIVATTSFKNCSHSIQIP